LHLGCCLLRFKYSGKCPFDTNHVCSKSNNYWHRV
jgi:hypothetical protein